MPAERLPLITSAGQFFWLTLAGPDASTVRAYWHAVQDALAAARPDGLQCFAGVQVQDEAGHGYSLLTDREALYSFFAHLTDREHRELVGIFERKEMGTNYGPNESSDDSGTTV